MDQQCEASGQSIDGRPPANEPMMCPSCGRAVDVVATSDGYEIDRHQPV